MLNSVYLEKIEELSNAEKKLTEAQISLLTAIQSKTRFEELMEVLPENWEEFYTINFYSDPGKVSNDFMNRRTYKTSNLIFERRITSVIVSDKHPASPGKYEEYLKRDTDYPISADKWKVYMGLTELVRTSFHIDHKLIWIAKERKLGTDSNYRYSINVYIPNVDYLINAETIKINNLI